VVSKVKRMAKTWCTAGYEKFSSVPKAYKSERWRGKSNSNQST